MVTKTELWEWYCSLDEVEQFAIRQWVYSGDRTLLLQLAGASENLLNFVEIVFAQRDK